ncbi:MAG: hypothetical protein A4E66_01758 [Syntrophus sp. PtaB.Bin001]|nr:MAG: hypothetical protein A4E66_01758 [Syntrophus sp. PtaB.Bin001]
MMRVFADRLFDVLVQHKRDIAASWATDVRKNPKTPSFKEYTQDQCINYAVDFYENFIKVFFESKPYPEQEAYFSKYAERRFKEGIPLHEAIHALIMMRRHLWLFADMQVIFTSPLDQYQAVETITRTIRLFDHAIYIIIRRYKELEKEAR